MTEWKLIENAPRDGTKILLWDRESGPVVGWYGAAPKHLQFEENVVIMGWHDDDFMLFGEGENGWPKYWIEIPKPPEKEYKHPKLKLDHIYSSLCNENIHKAQPDTE